MRRQHGVALRLDDVLEGAALVPPIGARAVEVVDLPDVTAGEALDLARELHERHAERIAEHAAERRFAGAAQADERDPPRLRPRAAVAEQLRDRDPRPAQLRIRTTGQRIADQQPFGGRRGHVADHLGNRAAERRRKLLQDQERRIADALLEIRQVALGHAGCERRRLARESAPRAQRPQPRPELVEAGVAVALLPLLVAERAVIDNAGDRSIVHRRISY
jgi:hypothetical protein